MHDGKTLRRDTTMIWYGRRMNIMHGFVDFIRSFCYSAMQKTVSIVNTILAVPCRAVGVGNHQ